MTNHNNDDDDDDLIVRITAIVGWFIVGGDKYEQAQVQSRSNAH